MRTKHIALLLVATLLLSNVASAGFFGDFWNKVTGKAVTPPVPETSLLGAGGRVATGNPIGPEAPRAQKLTAKGLLQQAENQVKLLTNAPAFKTNKNAQAALKKITTDLNQLRTITATEKPAASSTTRTPTRTATTRTTTTRTLAATTR